MTRTKEIKEAAKKRTLEIFGELDDFQDRTNGFIEGAQWSDETMIKKVEKWLENFLEKTIKKPLINDSYTSDTIDLVEVNRRRLIEEVLYDFKKAMEL